MNSPFCFPLVLLSKNRRESKKENGEAVKFETDKSIMSFKLLQRAFLLGFKNVCLLRIVP